MKLNGARDIPVPPSELWQLILDQEILKKCIPGCEELSQVDGIDYKIVMLSKVGPIKARFVGKVVIDKTELPERCKLLGEGTGGVAGFVKGSAAMQIEPAQGGSRLHFDAEVEIGGKIASLGDRLFRGVVERNIEQLFDSLQHEVTI